MRSVVFSASSLPHPRRISTLKTSVELNEINAALSAAQGELTHPARKKTAKVGTYSYRYADLADCIDVWRPVLKKHGLSLAQPITSVSGGVVVTTRLSHSSGQYMEDEGLTMFCGMKPQEVGSAITYGRRYGGCSMLGIAPDDDEDGQLAQDSAKPVRATAKVETEKVYDRANKAAQDWLLKELRNRNIPEDAHDNIGNRLHGMPATKLVSVIAEVMGAM